MRRSGSLEQLAGVAVGALVGALAAEHAANLFNHILAVEALYAGRRALTAQVLLDAEVGRGERGDLRKVGDAEDLAALAESAQSLADDAGGLATNPGVDLVEDQGLRPGRLAETT